MSRQKADKLEKGEVVYARWHGETEFEVVEEVFGAKLRHYKCRTWIIHAQKYDYWIFPQIHLSRHEIGLLIGEANRKQLSLV